jgi:hypothetical protein
MPVPLVTYIRDHRDQLAYVLLAELGLIVMFFVVLMAKPTYPAQTLPLRAAFALICCLGIIAGLFPASLSFSRAERRDGEGVSGHHPDCERFIGHTVNLLGKKRCAGCTGLVLGATASLIGLALGTRGLGVEIAFWGGVILVGLGLAQHFIDMGNEWVHLVLNAMFVVGAWLMFESVQALGLGVDIQVYFLSMAVFWVWARIRASQWDHVGVCSGCHQACVHVFE